MNISKMNRAQYDALLKDLILEYYRQNKLTKRSNMFLHMLNLLDTKGRNAMMKRFNIDINT